MKRIRTEPHDHAAEGDERIRTAVPAPGADPVYDRTEEPVFEAVHWDYDMTTWGPIGRTRDDVVRAIKDGYGEPYQVKWEEDDDYLVGHFEQVIGLTAEHTSRWEIEKTVVVSYRARPGKQGSDYNHMRGDS